MNQTTITPEAPEDFLLESVPSFREDCKAGRKTWTDWNIYSLLFEFEKHLQRLQSERRELSGLLVGFAALNELLARGNKSVRDAAVIQVVDLLIRNDKLREPAMHSGFATLAGAIREQSKAWEESGKRR